MKNFKQRSNYQNVIRPISNTTQIEGFPIETDIRKAMYGQGEIRLTRAAIYPDKKFGVQPEHDIRTDRMAIMRDAIGLANEKYIQAHQMRLKAKFEPEPPKQTNGEPTSSE